MTSVKTDNGHWSHTEGMNPEKYYGFIYLISDYTNAKLYIGKKQYISVLRLPPLKGYKRRRIKKVEMDWRNYTSSSTYVNEAIKENGIDKFSFDVLTECISKADLTYQEVAILHEMEVLTTLKEDGTPRYYNRAIGNIKFIPPLKVSDKTRKKMSEAYFNRVKKICPKCKVEIDIGNFIKEKHGSNCEREEGERICSDCKKSKCIGEFHKEKSRGGSYICRECKNTHGDRIEVNKKLIIGKKTKICYGCNRERRLDKFGISKTGLGGKTSICLSCRRRKNSVGVLKELDSGERDI